ncbi:PilW family protein [Vibrio algarum]|uniref:Prepilin-type N-terminal cleavage/methylation domain-containing protein n=1 Tax=Vibrio algarum TaxID=3020714 RepID=A0ABT4YN45_9VIBR|nr:prepilin-type N-terminal cleavage/methylation domain-containing protein [Vibrio sp. KJ40-1]MDB1122875.1 prepilin-type N-terminal cleavage/methylation domain-containing protein [Vibrio sp. KJ40-1]
MKIKGFTLIEMVMTIIIVGIIFIGAGSVIEMGSRGYADSIDRQRIQNQARFIIEKITREIRHAVPNSFNVVSDPLVEKCLTFYPINNAGFYSRNEIDRTLQFVVDNQGARMSGASGDRLTINPSQPSDLTNNSRSVSLAGCRDNGITSCTEVELGTSSTVYSYKVDDDFDSHSISRRYYTYSDLVSYCISSTGVMTKAVGSGSKNTVGDGLDFSRSQFKYTEPTLQRGGLVHMDLLFVNDDEESFYKHDVQVLNVP